MRIIPSFVNGLANTSFMPANVFSKPVLFARCVTLRCLLTPLEVGRDVLSSDVGRHGDNGNSLVRQPNARRGRNAVEHRHDDIHEDEIELVRVFVDLGDGL